MFKLLKSLVVLMSFIVLSYGCASNISYNKDTGLVTANDYNIVETYQNGQISTKTYVPSRFFDLANVMSQMKGLIPLVINQYPVPNPAPTPVPTPTPAPVPVPVPVPTPTPTPAPVPVTGTLTVCDYNLIPDMMRAQGWSGTDNQLDFALMSTYGSHPWGYTGDPGTPGSIETNITKALHDSSNQIAAWFSGIVAGIGNQLQANPSFTAVAIANDANDKGGLYMVGNIQTQLQAYSGRVSPGDVYYPATRKPTGKRK